MNTDESIACRICGCVDEDCSWCIFLTGEPCYWQEPDLCSVCAKLGDTDEERARRRGRWFLRLAKKRVGRAPGGPAAFRHGTRCLRVAARLKCERVKGKK